MARQHFIIYTRRKDKYRHVSLLAFPRKEAERRRDAVSSKIKLVWKITLTKAPEDHVLWEPIFDDIVAFPLGDLKAIVERGRRQHVAHQYYGLLDGAPNKEEFLYE